MRILNFIFALLFSTELVAQLKEITGDWKPQSDGNSCWAACLSNLSRPNWSNSIIIESHYLSKRPARFAGVACENLDTLQNYLKLNYKYQFVKDNSILSWRAFTTTLGTKTRPFLISFFAENNYTYHMINVYGFEKYNKIADERINKWLYIYDPKPDGVGKPYLKNYESYKVKNNASATGRSNKEGTFFNIKSKHWKYKKVANFEVLATPENAYATCIPNNLDSIRKISRIILKNASVSFRRKTALPDSNSSVVNSKIRLSSFISEVSPSVPGYQSVKHNSAKSFLIPIVTENNNTLIFKTGIIFRYIRDTTCLVVDVIEDISFINNIPDLARSLSWKKIGNEIQIVSPLEIIIDDQMNRYVRLNDKYYDFKSNLTKPEILTLDDLLKRLMKTNTSLNEGRIINEIRQFDLKKGWQDSYKNYFSESDFNRLQQQKTTTRIFIPIFKE